MADHFICTETCPDCDERCFIYGFCLYCENYGFEECLNCNFLDEEKNND